MWEGTLSVWFRFDSWPFKTSIPHSISLQPSWLFCFSHVYSIPVILHVTSKEDIHILGCPWHFSAVFRVLADNFSPHIASNAHWVCFIQDTGTLYLCLLAEWYFLLCFALFPNNLCSPFWPSLNVWMMFSEHYPQWDLLPDDKRSCGIPLRSIFRMCIILHT